MLRAFGVIVPTYQPRSNIIFPTTRINSRASHLTVASSAMSSQDIVVREPVLLPLEDYLGATPIPHLPLENTDKFYKLYMEGMTVSSHFTTGPVTQTLATGEEPGVKLFQMKPTSRQCASTSTSR